MKTNLHKSLFTIACLLCSIGVYVHDFEVDGIYYNITSETDKTIEVAPRTIFYGQYTGSVIIPENVNYNGITYNVTSIGNNAFNERTGLTSVTIPNSVASIGGYKDELKPVFKSTPTQFQTIIYATADTQNVGDHDGDMSETKLTERQQKILNLIKESPTITGKQMSETLSVSQRTIERDLSALQKKGILKHEGKDNDGAWMMYAASKNV